MTDDEIVVGITDPGDVVALDDVRAATGLIVRPVVVARSEVRKIIERLQREESDLGDIADEPAQRRAARRWPPRLTSDRRRADRAVRQLADRAGDPEPRLRPAPRAHRGRHAGALPHRRRAARDRHRAARRAGGADLPPEDHVRTSTSPSAGCRRTAGSPCRSAGRKVDLRIATLPTVWGEKIVLRVLDTGGIDLDLTKLGFTEDNYERFSDVVHQAARHGAGHRADRLGQVDHAVRDAAPRSASPPINIITVEDPVEYRLPGVNQVQVNAQGRPDLRRRAAGDPALRPGRRADR